MAFMEPQIEFTEWYEIETENGNEVIPAELVGHPPMILGEMYSADPKDDSDGEGGDFAEFIEELRQYVEGEI